VSHSRAATALLLVLIAACTMAFLRAEQLKLDKSPVSKPRLHQSFSPGCTQPGCHREAKLQFALRSPQTISLAIADMDGNVVRTLERARAHPKGDVRFTWDGLSDGGAPVSDGRYELQVTIPDRTITIPEPILVDTERPGITLNRIDRGETIRIHYTKADENSRAIIVVLENGKVVREQRVYLNPAHLPTPELAPGRYVVQIIAIDAAGNRTTDPPSFRVTVP
jgi:flagellar hook capping protein FlgD